MSLNSSDKQQLALKAYGFYPGFSNAPLAPPPALQPQTQGCIITSLVPGVYTLVLDADSGVVDGQSMTDVTVKGVLNKNAVIEDTVTPAAPYVGFGPNRVKTISVFDGAGALVAADIEVKLYASTINPNGP
jgi:hypothetical protein